ncbi:MAG: retron St85 family effector protein [Desulfovibrio sp.]
MNNIHHELVTKISQCVKDDCCYLEKDATIVFVCGKKLSAHNSKRKLFLDYANAHIDGFHFLLAEDFFNSYKDEDLLTIENMLTNYSDCIIIILESESAYAELGAFAAKDDLCKILLPINDQEFQGEPSFINQGPLLKIDKLPHGFGPTINADMKTFSRCFPQIEERLNRIKKSRREKLSLQTAKAYNDHPKKRLLLLHDIINLFSPINKTELFEILTLIYGNNRFDTVKFDLALLTSLGFIEKTSEYIISAHPGLRFISFELFNFFTARSQIIIHYKKKFSERLKERGKRLCPST